MRRVISDSQRPYGLQPTRLLCPWNFPGENTGVGYHFLLQEIFPTQGSNRHLLHCRWILYHWARGHAQSYWWSEVKSLSHVRLFATPWTVAYQAPPSMGFSRQECWTGLPTHKCYQIWVQFAVSLWWRSWVSWLLWGSNTPAAIWELGGDNRWQREVW